MTDTLAASSLDDFRRWHVDVLKTFVRKRGLKVGGRRKEELVALAFASVEMCVQPKPTAVEEDQSRALQYQRLLLTKDGKQPDPFVDLTVGWLNEKDAMTKWPPIFHFEIGEYLLKHTKDKNLNKRLLSDYKEGKAYSYFDARWLKDVTYHGITDQSNYCYLQSTSVPSQNINSVAHKVWVLVRKKTGDVESAYCTCFAGYIGGFISSDLIISILSMHITHYSIPAYYLLNIIIWVSSFLLF